MMTIGKKGGVIRGEGIQLRVPPNAIGRQQSRTISLRACIDGPFQLPEDVHLASPVFLVTCTPHYDFQREVALTLHHFVQLISCEECDMMVLLTSPQTPTRDKHGSHWRFEVSDKQPRCFQNITFGEVELTHFSFVCFGIRISRARRVHPRKEMVYHDLYRLVYCLHSPMQYQKALPQIITIKHLFIHQCSSAHPVVLFFSVSVFAMKYTEWLDCYCEHNNINPITMF